VQIIEKLGSRIPIITNVSSGIIGVDGIVDELFEVCVFLMISYACLYKLIKISAGGDAKPYGINMQEKWETTSGPNIQESDTAERGLVLLVGFLPGLKIGTIPLLQPRQVRFFVLNGEQYLQESPILYNNALGILAIILNEA
jgi:hypothetical protein